METNPNHEPAGESKNKLTLMQKPNLPIIIALAAVVVAAFGADYNQVYAVALAIAVVSFTAWAWWEATGGINWLRKTIGWIGLVAAVIYLYFQFA